LSGALQPGEVQAVRERLEALRTEVGRVFIGSPRISELMLVALLAGGHVLLEGVPAWPRPRS
jgi:MoxR-like ATPase